MVDISDRPRAPWRRLSETRETQRFDTKSGKVVKGKTVYAGMAKRSNVDAEKLKKMRRRADGPLAPHRGGRLLPYIDDFW